MAFQDQVETLTRLGLTVNQSKVIIALFQSKQSTVTQIAKSANLAREVVYRNMSKLQKIGLITKIISFPTEFEAIPVDLAVSLLLNKRAQETREINARTTELVEKMKNMSREERKREHQVVAISGRDHLAKFSRGRVLETQISLDTMIRSSRFSRWWENFHLMFGKLLAKNVQIRIIVAGSKKTMHGKNLEQLEKHPNFRIKFIPDEITTGIGIIDNKDALINTLAGGFVSQASFYWSNDPGVITLCSAYFEKYWFCY